MKQHIMGVHLRQYAYSCPICGEGYRRKKDMLLHMEQHKVMLLYTMMNTSVNNYTGFTRFFFNECFVANWVFFFSASGGNVYVEDRGRQD